MTTAEALRWLRRTKEIRHMLRVIEDTNLENQWDQWRRDTEDSEHRLTEGES